MNVEYDRSFLKAIEKIKDRKILNKIEQVLLEIEKANSMEDITNSKKLSGYKSFYRIKFGDYRLGFEFSPDNIIRVITVAHRKDIYRKFP